MPRDATVTRERLLREAERLFARRGVHQVTLREITEAAGQRNVSALQYHFGSREGVLEAIIERHETGVDEHRARLLDACGLDAPTRDLMAVLLVPYGTYLATAEGRDFLRIVAQLTDWFLEWRLPIRTGPALRRVLTELASRPASVPVAVREARIVQVIQLMAASMAQRALITESGTAELDEATFLGNLADVLVGVVEAPLGPPLASGDYSAAGISSHH